MKSFEVDYHDGTDWKLLGKATTINAHRILLTDTVTTDRVRLRITDSFACPVINRFSLYLEPIILKAPIISRNTKGMVTILKTPKAASVSLKDMQTLSETKRKTAAALKNIEIFYTMDNSQPNRNSRKYTEPFPLPEGGIVKAISVAPAGQSTLDITDPTAVARFGIAPVEWKSIGDTDGKARTAFDSDENTFSCFVGGRTIDTGRILQTTGFSYLPRQDGKPDGIIELYEFFVSEDGVNWDAPAATGRFDNIVNSPTNRIVHFEKPHNARYFRLVRKPADGTAACTAELGLFVD